MTAWLFVTWRLHGTLPAGRVFRDWDRALNQSSGGPRWLALPALAETVMQALLSGAYQWNRYELGAWVIMPNHVHLLARAASDLARGLAAVKSGSGREANRLLGRAGHPFWHLDSCGHWLRADIERAVRYIEHDPVRAGLARAPEAWPWSSARAALRTP